MLNLWPRAFREALRRFGAEGGMIMSSHVAMSMMLALFPFLLFVLSLAVSLSQDVNIEEVIDLVLGAWPDTVAAPIEKELRAVAAGATGGLMTLGALLTLFFASNGIDAVRLAMSTAYHDQDRRPVWLVRLISLGLVIVGAIGVLIIAAIGVAVPLYLHFVSDAAPRLYDLLVSGQSLNTILTLVIVLPAVTACHVILPGGRHSFRTIWPGVVLTVVLWIALGKGFAFYVVHFASYSAIYAGLAGAMSALIYLYLFAAILIFGAEFNGALRRMTRAKAKSA